MAGEPSANNLTDVQRLRRTLQAGRRLIAINTFEEQYALSLVRDIALSLGRPLWLWTVADGIRDGMLADSGAFNDTDKATSALTFLERRGAGALCVMLDLGAHLGDARVLRQLRNTAERLAKNDSQLLLIDHASELPPVLDSLAYPFELSLPDPPEIEKIVRDEVRRCHRERPIDVEITRDDLNVIVRNLGGLTRRQAREIIHEVIVEDLKFDAADVNHVLAAKRRVLRTGGLLEFVATPVDLTQIGGLRRLKHWLVQRERSLADDAERFGLPAPRGVLLLGVQGAGKSLCAKATAVAWRRPLLRMDVGALYDKYVGASEKRLRDALHQAEMMAPIVLWIDEIEKAFASAASQSTDGGLSKRMFGSLLTWMQEHQAPVSLVATANDIEALPPELLRKGRFDEIFFVDLPVEQTRREIFAIHLRRRGREPADFDLEKLANQADGYSGAEIEQAVVSGLHTAFSSHQQLNTQHVLDALAASPPLSVTMAERVAALRAWAANRCTPAD